jgi:hypothetical protein
MRAFLVLLVFAILGPPLGAAIVLILGALFAGQPLNWSAPAGGWLQPAGLVLMVAYMFGGIQALIVGIVMCAWYLRGKSKLLPVTPVLIATAVVVLGVLAFAGMSSVESLKSEFVPGAIAVHFGASLGCWAIANLLLWPMRHRSQEIVL